MSDSLLRQTIAAQRSRVVKRRAAEFGFDRCGVAPAAPIARSDYFRHWLAGGFAGTMGFLHRHADSRLDVRSWLPAARSVIVVALNYRQPEPSRPDDRPRGRVAMYAWGEDYHVVLREKLEGLLAAMRSEFPEPFEARVCVDTSAIIERELAAMAGIGWIGKNTMVMHQDLGSYFFLGEIMTDLDLAPDAPVADHCGSCTRCLDACPTKAFPRAYEMDARRCISYLTIEHRGPIDPVLAADMGGWVYGCDVCQQVCPYNRDAPMTDEARFAGTGESAMPALEEIEALDEASYRRLVAGKATERARLEMWKRNAAIARENLADGNKAG